MQSKRWALHGVDDATDDADDADDDGIDADDADDDGIDADDADDDGMDDATRSVGMRCE